MKSIFFLKSLKSLVIIVFFSVASSVFSQTVYYADNVNGNDGNSGLVGFPKKTFTSVFATAPAGSIIDLTGTFTWGDVGETTSVTSGFTINKNMTIRGQGADQTIVQANALPDVANRRVFTINSGVTVVLEKLAIKNGKVANLDNSVYPADGGGLYNSGTLTLNFCRITQNYAIAGGSFSGGAGGGISHVANNTMTINGCTFDNNQANTGGALVNEFANPSGRFIITNSTFAYNKQLALVATVGGGAIWILNGTNIITNSTFAYNDLNNSNGSGTGNGASILVRQGNVKLKNNIFVNGTRSGQPLSGGRIEIAFSGGSAADEGNNIFGTQTGITFSATSWQPSSGGGYQNVGVTTNKCILNVDSVLQTNGATNGIVSLKTTGLNIEEGSTTANNGISIPTIDQRGNTRVGTPDIGAYEYTDPAPFVSCFSPSTGGAGTSVAIRGVNFTGASSVKFNSVEAASFTFNSDVSITAIAPESSTGLISVTTNQGTGNSSSNFVYPPTINLTGTLTAFSKCVGSPSAAQTFTVSGSNLTANLEVAAYTNLEYSLNGTTYSASLSLTPTSGSVAATIIYVRMTTASASLTSGNISLTSTNATTRTVAVSGSLSASPTITGSNTVTVAQTITLIGSGTPNASTPWASSNTNIASVSSSGVVTGVIAGTATITYMNSNGCTITSSITVTAITSPTLTISSTNGETGTSGAGWVISGTNLVVSGNAIVAPSVIETALASNNLTIVSSVTSPYNLSVVISDPINSTTPNRSFEISNSLSNDGVITINAPISITGALKFYGKRVAINADLTTTSTTSGDISISAIDNNTGNPPPISGNGNINIADGRTLFLRNSNSQTTSIIGGVISGTNSNVSINKVIYSGGPYGGDGTIVFTNNNLYNGFTELYSGAFVLMNDAPNPASKNFTGTRSIRIEPMSTSFTSTLSISGWSLASGVSLTLGKTGNIGQVSIDSNLNFKDLTIISDQITLNGNITLSGSANFNTSSALIVPSPVTFSTGGNFNLYTLSGSFNYDLIFPIPNLALSVGSTMQLGGSGNNRNITVNNAISIPGQIRLTCGNLTLNNNISNSNGQSIVMDCNSLNIPTPVSLSTNGMVQINPRTSGTAFTSLIDLTNLSILNTSTSGLSIGNSNNSTNGITLGNLTIPGTINLNIGGPININGDVKNTVGNFTLRGITTVSAGKHIQCAGNFTQNGNITFKSDANGTAAFGTLGGTYTTTSGTVTVERYIPSKRAFRFLSPSVTTTTSIKQNWQENAGSTAGLGTHITGTGGATNGFDVTATNNPSLFTFDNGSWAAVTNSNLNVLTAGTPYRLMVRGDRTTDLTTNNPTATATTLRATGALKTGNYTPTLNQSADGFSLIGNPYQAPIDIKAILTASTNMSSNVVYYWDPTLNTRGGYVTRDLTTDVNDVTSSFNQYVQPGQAVFVKKDNTANVPTMTITEANKSIANAAAGVFRNSNTSTDFGLLRVNLQANNQNIEGALALFNDNYTWNVTSEDATKMANLDEEVSFVQNNTNLAIALQSNPSTTSELPIKIDKMRHTNYQWQFELNNYDGATPYLYDNTNNSYTQINNGTVVPFTVDSNTTNRFKIVFQNGVLSNASFQNELAIYPNPAKAGASFYVDGITQATVTVYNLLGQTIPVQTKSQGNTLQVTPSTNLSQGVYLVNITTRGTTQQVKWIVE